MNKKKGTNEKLKSKEKAQEVFFINLRNSSINNINLSKK